MRSVLYFAAALAGVALAAIPAAAGRDEIARFEIAGTPFAIAYPDGYCAPDELQSRALAVLATKLPDQTMLTSFYKCDDKRIPGTVSARDYTVITTPKAFGVRSVLQSDLVRMMGPEYEPNVELDNKSLSATISNRMGTVVAGGVAIDTDLKPLGHDDICLYLGGVAKYTVSIGSYSQALAACTTAIGGRVLIIYRFGKQIDSAGVSALIRDARAIAQALRPLNQA